jgi:hypothetical protein
MSKILDEVLAANAKYAENFGDKGNLPLPPSRHFAVLTCMDARLDPAKYAGLAEGDAHVIRNAGGRASDDAIRSLVISYKLLGTPRMVCHPPHGLRDAAVHQRRYAQSISEQLKDRQHWIKAAGVTPVRGLGLPKAAISIG